MVPGGQLGVDRAPRPALSWAGAAILGLGLVMGAVLRIRLAVSEDGIFWPDEVYQSIEPAHRLVYGYGLVAWEFVEGARSWAFPGFVAGILGVARSLGLVAPEQYLAAVALVMAALATASIWAVHELATAIGASRTAAAAGAFAFALAAPALYFSFRASAEVVSTLPILLGLALCLRPRASKMALLAGGCLLGLAVLFRIQNGLYAGTLLAALCARRQWPAAALVGATLSGWILLLGILDWATWGAPFHSVATYVRFNLSPRVAGLYGSQPALYYPRNLLVSVGALAAPLWLLAAIGALRERSLGLIAALPVLLLSLLAHKEFRFIFPVLALACALAALGIDEIHLRRRPRLAGAAIGLLLAGAVGSALEAPHLRMKDLGQYLVGGGAISAYDYGGPANRLLALAGRESDLCGLRFDAGPAVWTGGYSRLHRDVPLYQATGPEYASGFFNYAIVPRNPNQVATVVATDGDLQLVRLANPTCVRDPAYSYQFEVDPLKGS